MMFEPFLKRKPVKQIELDLLCPQEVALKIISNSLDSPRKCSFLPSYLDGPDFQGKVSDCQFNIFVKWPRSGPSPATLEGQILSKGENSKLVAYIMKYPAGQYFNFNIQWLITFGVIAAISFVFAMIGLLKQTSWQFFPFILFFLSMSCLILDWGYSTAGEEAEKLEKFIIGLFEEVCSKNLICLRNSGHGEFPKRPD